MPLTFARQSSIHLRVGKRASSPSQSKDSFNEIKPELDENISYVGNCRIHKIRALANHSALV